MPGYFDHLWGGVSPRDAIIVTSRSARAMLESVFTHFRACYALPEHAFIAPRLENIPLGVSSESEGSVDLAATVQRLRASLNLSDSLIILTLARISPYSKMDLLPAIAALQRAQGMGLAGAVLVAAGWTEENDPLPQSLAGYAAAMGVRLVPFPRPSNEDCRALYALADIFLSPSDNIQETFGLTLTEAGAAGLPVIASDFDGYRDIVEHEVTGLLIPTLGYDGPEETNLLAGIWFDNQYHLKLAQQVAVDVPAMASALARLGKDSTLRRRMGKAARTRMASLFSWQRVIDRYCELWDSLASESIPPAHETALRAAAHPLHMDFAQAFAGHFSHTLTDATAVDLILRRTPRGDALYNGALPPLRYAGMEFMLRNEDMRLLLVMARKPVSAAALMSRLAEQAEGIPLAARRERAAFAVLWALKQDYIERVGRP
jgi:glycosyltransferase involved in cell wall biosynthesis